MNNNAPQMNLTRFSLNLDNGAVMEFSGRPFAGGSWYDEETGTLTRQKLYITESGEHVYSIITGQGQRRSRRAYRVSLAGESCTSCDGRTTMALNLEMLMLAVRTLAGMERADDLTLDMVEETLRAANC